MKGETMHPIESSSRSILVLLILPLMIGVVAFQGWMEGSITWQGFAAMVCFALLGALLIIWAASVSVTFSEAGIYRKSMMNSEHIPWARVIQAGILLRLNDGVTPVFCFTLANGKKWETGMNIKNWEAGNDFSHTVVAKYSRELREMIEKCYGPLDFDLSNES